MMNKLIILNNKKAQLITDSQEVSASLRNYLSFRAQGVEYTPAYQNGWDGITYLVNKKGEFPLGLLKMAQNHIITSGYEMKVEDRRPSLENASELNIASKLAQINRVPREHQIRILEAATKNRKGIIRATTGAGKTLCAALITAKFNKPTIIYVIGLDLLQQFHDLFSSIFEEEIGFIGAGRCEIKRINIASIWTIGKALGLKDKDIVEDDEINTSEDYKEDNKAKIIEMLTNTKVHIFDECHTIGCATIKEIYNTIDPEYIYGMSATPYREDGTDLLVNGILGEQIINVSASELIEKGLLVQPVIKFVSVPKMSGLSQAKYPTVYKEYIVENAERNALILKETKSLIDKGYKVLVLFKQINHGKILLELFDKEKINCQMLYGNDKLERRTEVKEIMMNGDIDVILASTIYDLGVDLPILNALVLCGSGKSTVRCLQRVGRVIRQHPEKKFVAVVDFFDQAKYLRQHSKKRYEVYLGEPGFKVYKSKNM